MASTPKFDSNDFHRLAERTEYEACLLEAVHELMKLAPFPHWPDAAV